MNADEIKAMIASAPKTPQIRTQEDADQLAAELAPQWGLSVHHDVGSKYQVKFRELSFLDTEVEAENRDTAFVYGEKRLAQYFLYYPARLPVPMLPEGADVAAILRHRDELLGI